MGKLWLAQLRSECQGSKSTENEAISLKEKEVQKNVIL